MKYASLMQLPTARTPIALRACQGLTGGSIRARGATRSYAEYKQPETSPPDDAEVQSARKYCIDTLRKYDTPSFLLRSYIPRHAQDAYTAIRTFNVDVARTADTTSTPTVGAMRLQFQRDAVAHALNARPPKQPVAVLLAKAAQDLQAKSDGKAKFSKSWFNRVIDTREQYLSNPPYPDMAALERYAENTYSTLMYLILQSLPMASLAADHVASHIGKATGIATVLRGLPLVAFPPGPRSHSNQEGFGGAVGATRQGAVLLPLDIMSEYGVKEEEVLRKGAEATGLKDAVFVVATRANDHLITARTMLKSLRAGQEVDHAFEHQDEEEHAYASRLDAKGSSPAQDIERSFGVFMPAIATSLWLEQLEKHDFDVFAPKLRTTDWRLPFKAWWAFTRKKI